MSYQTQLYVASKAVHAQRWLDLRDRGVPICSTWIDQADEGATADWGDLWERCVDEASGCGAVLAYYEDDEVWKGAYVEIGAALANQRPVFVAGAAPGSWRDHPLVTTYDDFEEALAAALAFIRNPRVKIGDIWESIRAFVHPKTLNGRSYACVLDDIPDEHGRYWCAMWDEEDQRRVRRACHLEPELWALSLRDGFPRYPATVLR